MIYEATLGEICDRSGGVVQTGPFGSQLHQSDYRDVGIPVVMPQDVVDDKIDESRIARIDESVALRLGRHYLAENDIVFPRRGDIAKRAIIGADQEGYLCGTGCLKISIPAVELHPRYLFYFLAQKHIVKWIEGKAIGATMLNLNTGILRALPVTYPDIKLQQEVVTVLSAYDDLIENNQNRIKLLEESARLLYREWFVQLRFPGHERVKVKDRVPEGWERSVLEDALVLQRGFDLPHSVRREGDVPVYASTGVVGYHNEAMAKGPGVVTGRSGTLGRVHYIEEDYWPLNTSLWVKQFKRVTPVYGYFLLSALDMSQYNSGASVPTLDRKVVHQLQVLIPARGVLKTFDEMAQPLFSQVRALSHQIEKLKQARDALLPKLMSGALQV